MNDRIKKLAEEAGMNIKTNISGVGLVFGTFEGYKTSHVSVEELEKFAELIVRQSAKVGSHYGGNVKHLILHYFGVEP
jgi:heterodisulfide reductase subunit B